MALLPPEDTEKEAVWIAEFHGGEIVHKRLCNRCSRLFNEGKLTEPKGDHVVLKSFDQPISEPSEAEGGNGQGSDSDFQELVNSEQEQLTLKGVNENV